LRRLYVALTRAVSRLVVLHDQPLPAELVAGR
jgi:ATP-dependent exoDNAse (exonuclease V) beta subunit